MKKTAMGAVFLGLAAWAASCAATTPAARGPSIVAPHLDVDPSQTPTWSDDDLAFFLHGSMSTEVLPERVFAAFHATYPDLFPGDGLSAFGLVVPEGEPPIGVSRREVPRLGGLSSLGLNCASCHVVEIRPEGGGAPVRVLGTTGHFDAEALIGAVVVAQFRTQDAANMTRFLEAWLAASDPSRAETTRLLLADPSAQRAIAAAIAEDPSGAKGAGPGGFQTLDPADLALDAAALDRGVNLPTTTRALLRLFHDMRAALHVPDQPPTTLPPASGPGRNDAFGLLAAALFQSPSKYAPVKYGVLWNASSRPWVHWDGNTRSALGRNLLAALGLGAPLVDGHAELDLALVKRHTDLTQSIRPPKWPWDVDGAAAARGAAHYAKLCASCHDGAEDDSRLHAAAEIGTDPTRAREFDAPHAELFNRFFRTVKIDGFFPPKEAPIRSTGKYWTPRLEGAWARSPYLHDGSVRTMEELLTRPAARAKSFHRGSKDYDVARLGFTDEGPYVVDCAAPGNGNGGHEYGTTLSAEEKRELIEFLKTR